MFNESLSDPTAGERARLIRSHPEIRQPILDPTDPRSGLDATNDQPADTGRTPSERATERSKRDRD